MRHVPSPLGHVPASLAGAMARLILTLAAAALAAVVPAALATEGVDVSQPVSGSAASCMHSNGKDFAIVRAWLSYGAFDSAAPGSVKAFWDGVSGGIGASCFGVVAPSPRLVAVAGFRTCRCLRVPLCRQG